MGIINLPSFGTDPASITAAGLDGKVDPLATEFNGGIDNDNIASDAAIGETKLNLATITQNITHSGTMTHSGTVTMSSKAINEAKGSDIASATTTDIGAAVGNFVDVTGTTTITGLGTVQAGTRRWVRFTGILTLTHNATSLILPGAANITTAANDRACFVSLGSGNWLCLDYVKASGVATVQFTPTASNALAGSVVQTVNTQTGAVASGATTIPFDDTIPQNTEGNEFMTLAITPTNASNLLLIEVVAVLSNSLSENIGGALFQDSTAGALAAAIQGQDTANFPITLKFKHKMTAGTTSSTTFKLRAGSNSGTTTFNGNGGARLYGGVLASSITIMEIKV